jgi:hypothetical protein
MLAATAEKGSQSGQAAINAQGGCLKASGQQPLHLPSVAVPFVCCMVYGCMDKDNVGASKQHMAIYTCFG